MRSYSDARCIVLFSSSKHVNQPVLESCLHRHTLGWLCELSSLSPAHLGVSLNILHRNVRPLAKVCRFRAKYSISRHGSVAKGSERMKFVSKISTVAGVWKPETIFVPQLVFLGYAFSPLFRASTSQYHLMNE